MGSGYSSGGEATRRNLAGAPGEQAMADDLSVVIPAYNAAPWLEPTLGHIEVALREAGIRAREADLIHRQ